MIIRPYYVIHRIDNLRTGRLKPFCALAIKRLTPTISLYAIVKELY